MQCSALLCETGPASTVHSAAQLKSVMLSAEHLGSFLLFVFAVKLSKELQ